MRQHYTPVVPTQEEKNRYLKQYLGAVVIAIVMFSPLFYYLLIVMKPL